MTGYSVREFAKLAAVTVRALHHYDRVGLLRPKRTAAAYRVYSLADLERLEQIVALKFLGLSLRQIQAVLDKETRGLAEVLGSQRRALLERRQHLDRAIRAIQDAESALVATAQGTAKADVLKRIIKVIEMEDDTEFTKKYYSEGAQATLAERRKDWSPEHQEQATKVWSDLFHDIGAALDEDPASPRAQELARRWQGLVAQFTKGDPELSAGLQKAWADRPNWSADMKSKTAAFSDQRIWDFIGKALAVRP